MDIASPAPALLDFEDARNRMVDSQIRPNKVSDPRVLNAMRRIPRERFLPPQLAARAYVDEDVPLGTGRALMEPMVLARLVQLTAPTPGDRALVVACGTGYGAAVLTGCGVQVTALEQDEDLLAIAREALPSIAPSVKLVSGPLAAGWPDGAPYDIILIEGALRDIPEAIGAQLRPHAGRLVTVRTGHGSTGKGVFAEMTPAGLRDQPVFDCATPLIPALLPAPGFVF
ncbi:MAG: protein-L-isoaspartate O-methyltransferase [Acetobacteraceae bacterium]|nr:protein-L-isoaspartate O-methyltransferase [Acetobacteraceae bacterium]